MCYEDYQRQQEVEGVQRRAQEETDRRERGWADAIRASEKEERENPWIEPWPDAMPMPKLKPDRQGRLSSRQMSEQALYNQFYDTRIRRENIAKGISIDVNDPAKLAEIKRHIAENAPNQLHTLDRVDALLAKSGRETTDPILHGDLIPFTKSVMGGRDPETVIIHWELEDCVFTVNRYSVPGAMGVAISNHRVLIMFRRPESVVFAPHSLSWDDGLASTAQVVSPGRAAVTITTGGPRGAATYVLEGDEEAILQVDEMINHWLTCYKEAVEEELRPKTLVSKLFSSTFGKLFKKLTT